MSLMYDQYADGFIPGLIMAYAISNVQTALANSKPFKQQLACAFTITSPELTQ